MIINSYYVYILIHLLLIIVVLCIYFGNIEYISNYHNLCKPTIGKIDKIILEEKRDIVPIKKTHGVTSYVDKFLFKLKMIYSYKINEKIHHGYFYNDGIDVNYEEYKKIKSYWDFYKLNKYIKIYYLESNSAISDINILNIQTKHINFYYKWGLCIFILFIVLVLHGCYNLNFL